jgi:hypothetical protein
MKDTAMRGLSILALILCAFPALAKNALPSQSTNQSTDLAVNLSNPPVPVGGLTIQQSGAAGPTNLAYYYWSVTRTIGNSTPVGPIGGFNASSTISSSNDFSIWNAFPSATRCDVLRTTTPAGPSEGCVCAVAVDTSSLSVSDQSKSRSAYTVSTFDPNSGLLFMGNKPYSSGAPDLILRRRPEGTFVADLSAGVGRGNATSTQLSVVSAGTGAILGQGYFWNSAGTSFALQTKIGYDARDYLQCDGSTDDTAALNKMLRTIGSTQAKIVLPNTGQCVLGNVVIPANLALDFSSGGGIKVNTRSTQPSGAGYVHGGGNNAYRKYDFITLKPGSGSILILGGIINPDLHQIFYNALPGEGTVDFTGNTALERIYPEWWGASPSASASVNTQAIQASIFGAFGQQNRTSTSGLAKYNRELHFSGFYQISDELKMYHVNNFLVTGEGRLYSGINQTASKKRIIDGECVAYGVFDGLTWSTTASQNVPLLDFDNNGLCTGADLSPQFLKFNQNTFNGNNLGQIGVLFAKSGGRAQGSNMTCYDCEGEGFTEDAWQFGGNNTGINTGRYYAYNALANAWVGGDFQANQHYGIAAYAGNFTVGGAPPTTFEDWSSPKGAVGTSFDAYCESSQFPCTMDGVRSEDWKLAGGEGFVVKNSKTVFNALQWPRLAGTAANIGQIISGSGPCGDGKYYRATNVGIYGGLGTTPATSGSTTKIVDSGASWTNEAFVGQQVCITSGTLAGFYGVITANTATTITVGAGWVTNYQRYASSTYVPSSLAPDRTSQFLVEPNWGSSGSATASGTVTFAQEEFNALAGDNGTTPCSSCIYEDVTINGGRIAAVASKFENLYVSRTDWIDPSLHPLEYATGETDWNNIIVQRPGSAITGGSLLVWAFPRESITGYVNYSQHQVGSLPMVWSVGANGSTSALDTWIGGRHDPFSGKSVSRAILEYGGLLGPATPSGIDQNAGSAGFNCGLSTGAGTPGTCNWYLGTTGASGTQVNSGSIGATLSTAGYSVSRYTVDKAATLTVRDFTLGAGWGSTAAIGITLATSKDQASVTTITAGGTGIEAKPTYQLIFHDGTWTQTPVCTAVQTGGNDIVASLTVTSRSATSYTFQWNGTPSSAKTYEISVSCMGT